MKANVIRGKINICLCIGKYRGICRGNSKKIDKQILTLTN